MSRLLLGTLVSLLAFVACGFPANDSPCSGKFVETTAFDCELGELHFFPDGKSVLVHHGKSLEVFDLRGKRLWSLDKLVRTAVPSPDGQTVLGAGWSGDFFLWSSDGRELDPPACKGIDNHSCVFSGDGKWLFSGNDEWTRKFSTADWREAWTTTYREEEQGVAGGGGGTPLAADKAGAVVLTETMLCRSSGEPSPTTYYIRMIDGGDGSVRWSHEITVANSHGGDDAPKPAAEKGREHHFEYDYDERESGIFFGDVSADGALAAVAGFGRHVHVFDSKTGKEAHTLLADAGQAASALRFSKDGALLAAAFITEEKDTGMLKLFDTTTWQELQTLECAAPVLRIDFAAAGNRLAVADRFKIHLLERE